MRCRWRMLVRAEICREKQEHFLTHPVLSLDDVVTADESLREQFLRVGDPKRPNRSAHNDRPSKRGLRHCRSPFRWQPFFLGWPQPRSGFLMPQNTLWWLKVSG